MSKPLLNSKTFWLAIFQALLGATIVFHSAYPDVGWILLAKSALDISLRWLTTAPIKGW